MTEFLPIGSIHNFRDYGGYQAAGGRVKRGLLFRSGQHAGASDDDLARVDALALRTVIDLRGNSERERHPCRRSPRFAAELVFHDGETSNRAPHDEAAQAKPTPEDARQRMRAVYRRLPYNPAMIDIFRRYFAALTAGEGASLVHCFAGKDRTGVGVALVHHALGVHPDDAMADYLRTNDAPTFAVLASQSRQAMKERYEKLDEETLRVLLEVEPSFLQATRARIAEEHGSADRYLAEVLGVDETVKERLRALYLA